MYYTPGHLCSGGVVHHYSYQSAQFDENHTLVQFDENYTLVEFVETIIWFNLMKLYMFFKLMGKMCVAMVINIDPIPLYIVTVRLRCVIFRHGTADLSRPSEAKA